MTEEFEPDPVEVSGPAKPEVRRVSLARKTRGYALGVIEVPEAEAEALVAAGVARYVK